MRSKRAITKTAARVLLLAVLEVGVVAPAFAQTGGPSDISWARVMNAISRIMSSWRFPTIPHRTATAVPITRTPTAAAAEATATRAGSPTRIPSATRTGTSTRVPTATLTPSRTKTSTRTATETRVPTDTRPPTDTPSPRPTSTPIPTSSGSGQIAFAVAEGIPPEQKLASAVVVFPYIETSPTKDTRIELMNMSNQPVELQCFYVRASDCVEIGFFVSLTARQPLSWLANDGMSDHFTGTAVPPFDGRGELKCAVNTLRPELSAHNVLQGRALVYDIPTGETVGYGAVGFQRLSPGAFSGVIDLDGFTYESCPERLHFQVLTRQGSGGATSDLIVVTCAEDLLTQTPTETVVQLQIVNEFEQVFSSSFRFQCLTAVAFTKIPSLGSSLGTETAHLVARGVASPLIALVIERFMGQNATLHTTANEPFLEGGRSATIIFP